MFHHDLGSFNELWRQVARETGTRWVVDVSLVSCGEWGLGEQGFEWHCEDEMGLDLVVTRSDEQTESSLL